jgi:phage shock protein A
MGVFQRLKTMISSHVNAWISKGEKPEKMLNQAILDMNEQLIESKRSVAQAIADEKRLERETSAQNAQADEWERKAMLAVQAGKDDLAKEALLRKQEYEKYYADYNTQLQAQHQSVDALKNQLKDLTAKIDEANRKKNLLIARAKRAEAQTKIQDTMNGMAEGKNSFATFERMEQKVDELEAQADASTEIASIGEDASLEQKFAQLEDSTHNSSGDQLLADLKAKMGQIEDKSKETTAANP